MNQGVWIVSLHDALEEYLFSTMAKANAYAEELRVIERADHERSIDNSQFRISISYTSRISVTFTAIDRPRRELPGAYIVEIDASGNIVQEGMRSYATPDQWGEGTSAHFWMSKGERYTTEDGAIIRASGIDKDEAMERATKLLATLAKGGPDC